MDDLTSFLGRQGMAGTVTSRDEIGIGAGRRFPSRIFSLFSIVISLDSFIVASVFGIAKGGDGKIVSHSNLSTKRKKYLLANFSRYVLYSFVSLFANHIRDFLSEHQDVVIV